MGLSQWGAWQGAREGDSFAQILAFYYPGTTLGPLANPRAPRSRSVSRAILRRARHVSFVSGGPRTAGRRPRHPGMNTSGSAYDDGDRLRRRALMMLNSGGKVAGDLPAVGPQGSFDTVELVPDGDQALPRDGRRGHAQRRPSGYRLHSGVLGHHARAGPGEEAGELWVYNWVPLEKYVRASPRSSYDWANGRRPGYEAIEAVKAQAVAARTYAVAKGGATLSDSWADQCYRGYTFEAKYPGIAKAATDTAGLILTYQGEAHHRLLLRTLRRIHQQLGLVGQQSLPTSWPGPIHGASRRRRDDRGPAGPGATPISADRPLRQDQRQLKDTSSDYVNVGPVGASRS